MRQSRLARPRPDVVASSEDISLVNAPSRVRQIVILGAGGHGRELADIVRSIASSGGRIDLLGVADDGTPDRPLLARSGIRFLGGREDIFDGSIAERRVDVHLGLGYPHLRAQVDRSLLRPATPLVHPTAMVGSATVLDDGAVLAQGVIVTTNVQIGRHAHLNVGVSVSHDCVVGDYATLCPQATVTGSVSIADRVFIGAGATILPGVSIGSGAIIGARAVVNRDVPAGATFAGVPARQINSSDNDR